MFNGSRRIEQDREEHLNDVVQDVLEISRVELDDQWRGGKLVHDASDAAGIDGADAADVLREDDVWLELLQ